MRRRLPVLADVDEQLPEVELNRCGVREYGGQWAEMRKGGHGFGPGEERDGSRDAHEGIVRRELRGRGELTLCRERLAEEIPERHAINELRPSVRLGGGVLQGRDLGGDG